MKRLEKEKIIENILNSDEHMQDTEEIEKLLEKELSKKDIDTDLVNELSLSLIEAKGGKEHDIDVSAEYEKFKQLRKKQSVITVPKFAYRAAACAAAVLVGLNVYTVSAYNENIFSYVLKFSKQSVTVDFNAPTEEQLEKKIKLSDSEDDIYGIIAKCKEVGFYGVETPHYIPDDFVLTQMETIDDDYSNYICFVYEKGKQLINFSFREFKNGIPNDIGFPSDEKNISEIEIAGHTAIMSREDNQMILMYPKENYLISICTKNVDYSECDKILQSYE